MHNRKPGKPFWALLLVPAAVGLGTAAPPPPTASPRPKATPAEPTITLAAVGDILLDRGMAQKITQYGLDYPFAGVRQQLRGADIAFGNLEFPFARAGTPVVKRFRFKVPPERAAIIRDAGLDVVSLANNHSMDCGRTGLTETMDALRVHGVRWCGAGHDSAAALAPTVVTAKGIRVAFIGLCEFLPEGVFLRDERPGIALLTENTLRGSIAAARRQADVVVVSLHWGVEYAARPRSTQQALARIAAEAGADVVLGHHPHVLQGWEVLENRTRDSGGRRRRTLVLYSMGNFVFDPPRGWGKPATRSAVFMVELSRQGWRGVRVVPVEIVGFRPAVTDKIVTDEIRTRLDILNRELRR